MMKKIRKWSKKYKKHQWYGEIFFIKKRRRRRRRRRRWDELQTWGGRWMGVRAGAGKLCKGSNVKHHKRRVIEWRDKSEMTRMGG